MYTCQMESLEKRYEQFKKDPKSPLTICNHIAQGGALTDLAETLDFPYHYLTSFIESDDLIQEQFNRACKMRDEWSKETLLNHLKAICFVDIGSLYNDDGTIKNIKQIDKQTRRAIASLDEEFFETHTTTGRVKKIKLNDKLKAIEILGKQLGVFRDKIEHVGKLTLEDLVERSYEQDPKEDKTKKIRGL